MSSVTEAYSFKVYSKQTEKICFCTQCFQSWCENVHMFNKYSLQKTISSLHINIHAYMHTCTHNFGLLNRAHLTSISLKHLQLSKATLEKEIISIKSRGHNTQTIN